MDLRVTKSILEAIRMSKYPYCPPQIFLVHGLPDPLPDRFTTDRQFLLFSFIVQHGESAFMFGVWPYFKDQQREFVKTLYLCRELMRNNNIRFFRSLTHYGVNIKLSTWAMIQLIKLRRDVSLELAKVYQGRRARKFRRIAKACDEILNEGN